MRTNDYIRAQLYYAPDGFTDDTAFVPVGTPAPVQFPPGRYNGGYKMIPVATLGQPIMIQVRAYETNYGGSYEQAEAAPPMNGRRALIGKSAIARVIVGGGPTNSSRAVDPFTVNVAGGGAYLTVRDIIVAEGSNGVVNANFIVSLAYAQDESVSVNYATTNGTALAGEDYIATSGTLTFAPGETSMTVTVPVTADAPAEPDETFFLNLSNPVNAFLVKLHGSCLITEVRVAGLSIDTSVSFNTVFNQRYVLEKSPDTFSWIPVPGATNVLGTGGIVTAVDRGSGCTGMMIYRARLLTE